MKCRNELHVVDGGDHSFKVGKKFLESMGSNQDEAEKAAVRAIAEFVSQSTNWRWLKNDIAVDVSKSSAMFWSFSCLDVCKVFGFLAAKLPS